MVWSIGRQTTARPGRVQRLASEPNIKNEPSSKTIEERLLTQKEDNSEQVKLLKKSLSVDESHQLDDECLQRFIKAHVRLMTEDHVSSSFF
jgi:hypothetical protein